MSVQSVGTAVPLLDTRALLEPIVNGELAMTDKLLHLDAQTESAESESATAIAAGVNGGLDVYA